MATAKPYRTIERKLWHSRVHRQYRNVPFGESIEHIAKIYPVKLLITDQLNTTATKTCFLVDCISSVNMNNPKKNTPLCGRTSKINQQKEWETKVKLNL